MRPDLCQGEACPVQASELEVRSPQVAVAKGPPHGPGSVHPHGARHPCLSRSPACLSDQEPLGGAGVRMDAKPDREKRDTLMPAVWSGLRQARDPEDGRRKSHRGGHTGRPENGRMAGGDTGSALQAALLLNTETRKKEAASEAARLV